MLGTRDILLGILVPGALSGVWLLVAWSAARRPRIERSGDWGGPLAIASAYVAGHAGLLGWPPFPPIEATQWIVYLAVGAALYGLASTSPRVSARLAWILEALMLLVGETLLLAPLMQHTWSTFGTAWRLAMLTAVALGFRSATAIATRRLAPAAGWLGLMLIAVGTALALPLSGSLLLGQIAGGLAAGLGAGWVLALTPLGRRVPAAALVVATVLFVALIVCGLFYSELPLLSALLLAAAPVLLCLLAARPSWLAIAAATAAILAAVMHAYAASPPLAY